jgi:hypothetical protein
MDRRGLQGLARLLLEGALGKGIEHVRRQVVEHSFALCRQRGACSM